jgi:acyl carrier protein
MSIPTVAAEIVAKAVKDVNAQRTEGAELVDSPDTKLLGDDGVIDSVTFAFLIVTIEQYALDDLDREIILFDDEVMEMDFDSAENPFATLESLTTFVARKLS